MVPSQSWKMQSALKCWLLTVVVAGLTMKAGRSDTESPRNVTALEIQFRHGNDILAGTLYLPTAAGPHPAVALVLGSGAELRGYDGVGSALGMHFAHKGFACLTWDKPGCGASTGNFNDQTLPDRADEALAAVHFLQARKDIQPECVGLWGHSQGGILIPLAAARSKDVAFLIEVSGWQGPCWEQDPVRVAAELRDAGFCKAEIDKATEFSRRRMKMIRGSGSFEDFDKIQESAKTEPWFAYVQRCDRTLFYSARRGVEYDSGPSWEKVHCPVLALYGEDDASSGPPEPLLKIIRHGLAIAGNADLTIQIFPNANHLLCQFKSSGHKAIDGPDFVPGYLDAMTNWLIGRFVDQKP